MNAILDLIDAVFLTDRMVEESRLKRKKFAEDFSKNQHLADKTLEEALNVIELNKMKLHKRGLSINEAFEWIVLPLSSEQERENFQKRFESSEMLNAFDGSLVLRYDPGFWIFLGVLAFFTVVPLIVYLFFH